MIQHPQHGLKWPYQNTSTHLAAHTLLLPCGALATPAAAVGGGEPMLDGAGACRIQWITCSTCFWRHLMCCLRKAVILCVVGRMKQQTGWRLLLVVSGTRWLPPSAHRPHMVALVCECDSLVRGFVTCGLVFLVARGPMCWQMRWERDTAACVAAACTAGVRLEQISGMRHTLHP